MYVGVIQYIQCFKVAGRGIPHVCGGDPALLAHTKAAAKYSPCMWG